MSKIGPSQGAWFLLAIYIGIPLIAGFIGFVKFMAWWRVAFGDCHP